MSKRYTLILVAVFLVSCSPEPSEVVVRSRAAPTTVAAAPEVAKRIWFQCEKSEECEVVPDMACTLASVNKEYAKEFQSWARQTTTPDIKETGCYTANSTISYAPVCDRGRCSSVRR